MLYFIPEFQKRSYGNLREEIVFPQVRGQIDKQSNLDLTRRFSNGHLSYLEDGINRFILPLRLLKL